MTGIIIVRHGNTFNKGETPRRIGAKTDIPLVEYHRAESVGKYLKHNNLIPSAVYAAPLLRTMETAAAAMKTMDIDLKISKLAEFTEIDYGIDENKTESEVFMRLGKGDENKGKRIVEEWNKRAEVPDGWLVNPDKIMKNWFDFAENTLRNYHGQNVMIVTSNGIIRFAPCLTGNFEKFSQEHDIKVATGGICIFERNDSENAWGCRQWNIKPYELY